MVLFASSRIIAFVEQIAFDGMRKHVNAGI